MTELEKTNLALRFLKISSKVTISMTGSLLNETLKLAVQTIKDSLSKEVEQDKPSKSIGFEPEPLEQESDE